MDIGTESNQEGFQSNSPNQQTVANTSEEQFRQEFETAAKPSFKTKKRTKNRKIAPKGAKRLKDEKTGEYYYLDKAGNKKPFYRKDPTVSKIFDGDK